MAPLTPHLPQNAKRIAKSSPFRNIAAYLLLQGYIYQIERGAIFGKAICWLLSLVRNLHREVERKLVFRLIFSFLRPILDITKTLYRREVIIDRV
jgi:hypothetical protein